MSTMSLNRIVFDGRGGAKMAERWTVGKRIRDVEQAPDGSLWMLEDANPGALIHVTPAKTTSGEAPASGNTPRIDRRNRS
jgi:glucose/arabinose dehydrogenase